MNRLTKCLAALCFVVFGTAPSTAAPGSALAVDPNAVLRVAGEQRVLTVGSDVNIGDLIQTDAGGHAELAFEDGTRIVVGPGSSLLIQDYLLRGNGTAGEFAVDALTGTFRFMSGTAAKDRYRITTPSGTIGIRGTEFDFVADGKKGTRVLMYKGSTELCAKGGQCVVISNMCELGQMVDHNATSLGQTSKFTSQQRRDLRSRFVYGASQLPLQSAFWLPQTSRCLHSPFGSPTVRTSQGGSPSATVPGGVPPSAAPPPVVTPPPATDPGGDCAGNSDHNPGHSQNCNH